jgi:hypothetical protein
MARIRSIHPGLFTDEAFASLSMAARVLLLGIWTEADDHGVFEWKPVTLKMRVMPADNVSVSDLLDEIKAAGVIKCFSSGKSYGLVRNFCRFQRPRKPNYIHPIPSELRTYVGLNDDGSLPVLKQYGTGSENPSQREEGEGSGIGIGAGVGAKERAPANRSDPGKGGTKLTLEFHPTDVTLESIRGSGFGEKQIAGEFSKFVQYYMARGYERVDWNAQLLSWFQRTKPDGSEKPTSPLAVVGKVLVIEGTIEERCWQQHKRETTGRSMPIVDINGDDGRTYRGWWCPTKFPPGYDDPSGEKLPASSDEAAA